MEIAELLLARFAEDEAKAREASVRPFDFMTFADHVLSSDRESTPSMDEHVDRWNPARVLTECEAKRRIVAELRDDYGDGFASARIVLRLLALPYADHPDFDPEWKV